MTITEANAHADLIKQLDSRVREIVRHEAVDPQRDNMLVRRIAEGVVRAHDERSLTGRVAPISDPDGLVGELVARVSAPRADQRARRADAQVQRQAHRHFATVRRRHAS